MSFNRKSKIAIKKWFFIKQKKCIKFFILIQKIKNNKGLADKHLQKDARNSTCLSVIKYVHFYKNF